MNRLLIVFLLPASLTVLAGCGGGEPAGAPGARGQAAGRRRQFPGAAL